MFECACNGEVGYKLYLPKATGLAVARCAGMHVRRHAKIEWGATSEDSFMRYIASVVLWLSLSDGRAQPFPMKHVGGC